MPNVPNEAFETPKVSDASFGTSTSRENATFGLALNNCPLRTMTGLATPDDEDGSTPASIAAWCRRNRLSASFGRFSTASRPVPGLTCCAPTMAATVSSRLAGSKTWHSQPCPCA